MRTISDTKFCILMRCAEEVMRIPAEWNNNRLRNLQRQAAKLIKTERKK